MAIEAITNKLITHPYYNPEETAEFFERRGWPVSYVSIDTLPMVPAKKGAAFECPDGRFADEESSSNGQKVFTRKYYGPKVFGGINVVAAMITGGDIAGFLRAARMIEDLGYAPGTHGAEHGGCGYYDLWAAGKLSSARYPLDRASFPDVSVKALMELLHGKHFKLPGEHVERRVRLNPFFGLTERTTDPTRFRVDDWALAYLNVPAERRFAKIAEVVEILKPDAAKLEIIYDKAT